MKCNSASPQVREANGKKQQQKTPQNQQTYIMSQETDQVMSKNGESDNIVSQELESHSQI